MIDINALSKSEQGRRQILKKFSMAVTSVNRDVDRQCWDLYNNQHNAAEYDYLRRYGDYELPAHVRHVPKQRPFIDWLVARQQNRPNVFDTYAVDKESLGRKHTMNAAAKAKLYHELYRQKGAAIRDQAQQLTEQRARLQQQLAAMQRDQQPDAAAIGQARGIAARIDSAIAQAIEQLSDLQTLNDQTLSRLRMMGSYTDRDLVEQWAQAAVRSLRRELNIRARSCQSLINRCVTGKEYYYVDYDPNSKKIIFRTLLPHTVFFQDVQDVLWVQDLDWAGFDEWMTPGAVIAEFGDRLSDQEIKSLESQGGMTGVNSQGPFVAGPGQRVYDTGRDQGMDYRPIGAGSLSTGAGVMVRRVWWLSDVKPRAIRKPNPHARGKYFTQIIGQESDKTVIDEKDYRYDNASRRYVHRRDPDLSYERQRVRPYNSLKGEFLETRCKYDRYKGVIIDGRIFLSERDIQVRSMDNPTRNHLPVVGPTFNNISQQPYSYIWATKDLQKLYNLINYHKELTLAVSGTKALLMDMVQKPKGMSDQEWQYHVKMGTIKIQTRREGIGQLQPSFNQFQMIDMSLSSSIQYFDLMLENIETQIGLIMGITRQSMGQVSREDQVGTFQMSQQSTLLVTQMLYDNHDEVERQAMNMALRLAKEYMFDEDTVVQVFNENLGEELLKIPAKSLRKADFDIIMESNSRQESSRVELMQMAMQNYKAGVLPFSNFIALYNTESLKELTVMSRYFDEQARELQARARQAEGEQAMALEERKAELAMQMEQFSARWQQQSEQMKLQYDQARSESEMKLRQSELELRARELDLRQREMEQQKALKGYELASRKSSEDNKVLESRRSRELDFQIELIQAELKRLELGLKKRSDDQKHGLEQSKARKQASSTL